MTLALITLSLITSLGIYGLLSTGFSTNIAKLEIGQKEVKNIEVKKERFEEIKNEYQKEKQTLDTDISKLRTALSTNTTTQSVDRQTGQVVTRANNANRKSFETQLQLAIENRDKMSGKVDALNDSITALDIKVLELESKEISGNELGTIKYISELTGWSVKKTANIFILILIFVFDPLAITLVIATNQAFKNNRKDEEDDSPKQKVTPQVAPQVTPQVAPQVTHELPHELTHELTHQVDEEVDVPESLLSINDSWEWIPEETEPVIEDVTEDVTEDGMEEIIEPQVEENKPEPQRELRRLSYGNRNGNGSGLRINRL
jgi:Skp family chaperone for outer membrane proteins